MLHPSEELQTFAQREPELKRAHAGEWVVISGREIAGVFTSCQEAAESAASRFRTGSFLIRQIGAFRPRRYEAA
jgi:hypothetical protein